jgi:hypothetical protein
MRNFTLILIAGAVTAASACVALADSTPAAPPTPAVAATTPAPATTPVAPTTSTDDNEIICKSSGPPTGSRLGSHRECKTKHDWDADRVRSEQDLSRFQDVHAGVGMGGH